MAQMKPVTTDDLPDPAAAADTAPGSAAADAAAAGVTRWRLQSGAIVHCDAAVASRITPKPTPVDEPE